MAQSTQKENMCAAAFVPSPPPSTSDHDASPRRSTRQRQRRHHHTRTNSSPCSSSSSIAHPPLASVDTSFASDLKSGGAPIVPPPDFAQDEEAIPSIEPVADEQDAHSDLDTVVALVKASWQGRLPYDTPEWKVFHISKPQYEDLCTLLEEQGPGLLDYFTENLRHDYNPERAILVLRLMATAFHECLQEEILFHIRQWLQTLGTEETPVLRLLASDIKSLGHNKVQLDTAEGEGWKSPDCQLFFLPTEADDNRPYHAEGYSPPFVIEVGYSQSGRALEDLAQEYYEDSGGHVKTVLTVDVKYTPRGQRQSSIDKTASFCLYRGPRRVHLDVKFSDADGTPFAGTSLQLSLADFIPDSVLDQLSPDDRQEAEQCTINMSSEKLCSFIQSAARSQRGVDHLHALSSTTRLGETSKKRTMSQWDKVRASPEQAAAAGTSSDEACESSRSKRRRVAGHRTDRPYRAHSSSTHGLPERSMQTRSMSRGRGD